MMPRRAAADNRERPGDARRTSLSDSRARQVGARPARANSTGAMSVLVLYGPAGLFAFEVKGVGRLRGDELGGLRAFRDDYPSARCVLLYRGDERLVVDGILCMNVAEFLTRLRPGDLPDALEAP